MKIVPIEEGHSQELVKKPKEGEKSCEDEDDDGITITKTTSLTVIVPAGRCAVTAYVYINYTLYND